MRLKYNTDTQLFFQIGDPVDHSTAAFLHNAMYDIANVDAICLPVFVKRGNLSEFVHAAKVIGLSGFDITMPHKSDIIPLLDECDEVSRRFHCVNHVKIRDGKLIGVGLDGMGMGIAVHNRMPKLEGKTLLLLGAGAVAGLIAADLCKRGCSRIIIANRTQSKADAIAATLREVYQVEAEGGPLEAHFLNMCAREADIVAQCTSLGMAGSSQDYTSLDFMQQLRPQTLCADVLYPTSTFLETAKSLGLPCINGLDMLLNQQIAMIDFHFGIKLPQECLTIAEESLACAVTLRNLRDERLTKQQNQRRQMS